MQGPARVQSLQALIDFRLALIKFMDQARSALAEAQGELSRTQHWLSHEQRIYWQTQLMRRQQAVLRAKEALRQKKLFATALNPNPSTAEEEKVLLQAQRALQEAEEKLAAVRHWTRQLEQESLVYHGQIQRFSHRLEQDLPQAVAWLARMVQQIQNYLALEAPQVPPPSLPTEQTAEASMALPGQYPEPSGPAEPPKPPEPLGASETPAASIPVDEKPATESSG